MQNTPQVKGIGCHWGVSTTGLTGYGSLVLTSTDHNIDADVETAQDQTGYVVTDVTYNHRETATLNVWISGSANASNATVADTTYPEPGDVVTIVDATNTALAGTNWIAGSANISRSNTSLARASVQLRRYAKIS